MNLHWYATCVRTYTLRGQSSFDVTFEPQRAVQVHVKVIIRVKRQGAQQNQSPKSTLGTMKLLTKGKCMLFTVERCPTFRGYFDLMHSIHIMCPLLGNVTVILIICSKIN